MARKADAVIAALPARNAAAGPLAFVPPSELPMPAETFVRVMHAVIDGLVFLHTLTPALVRAAEIRAAFDALAG